MWQYLSSAAVVIGALRINATCCIMPTYSREGRQLVLAESQSARELPAHIQWDRINSAAQFVMAVPIWGNTSGMVRSLYLQEETAVKSVDVW